MRKISSERRTKHDFSLAIFNATNSVALEGLTIFNDKFSTIVEAFEGVNVDAAKVLAQYQKNELCRIKKTMDAIDVNFNVIVNNEADNLTKVFEFNEDEFLLRETYDEKEFIKYWSTIKNTNQKKHLVNGGQHNQGNSIINNILIKYGALWGGNIDGIMFDSNDVPVAVVENIFATNINTADPGWYISSPNPKHGPRFNTWKPNVMLANALEVPLLLITYSKNNGLDERCGISLVKQVNINKVTYHDGPPNKNICIGKQGSLSRINKLLDLKIYPKLVNERV